MSHKVAHPLHNPPVWGILNASQRETKLVRNNWEDWLHNLFYVGGHQCFRAGTKLEVAHNRADWLHKPFRVVGSQRFTAKDEISFGPQMGCWG